MIHKRLIGVTIALAVVLTTGSAGYVVIEGWAPFDALYMTVITIASVGYMEVHELSAQGRIFTMLLILCGSATLIYGLSVLTAFIVEGELGDAIRRRKMKKAMAHLKGHFLVCGLSATGRYIIDELLKTGRPFIVLDNDPQKLKALQEKGILYLEGDATHEAVLVEANIGDAAGLFTTLHHDGDNLLVVVTAKGLRPDIPVVAKAIDEESERKLRQVGADRVVMPNYIGGLRMASEMIRPSVVSFLDTMLRGKEAVHRVEELHLPESSPLVGLRLDASGLLDIADVAIVAIAKPSGDYRFNPPREQILQPHDILIAMGDIKRIETLREQIA